MMTASLARTLCALSVGSLVLACGPKDDHGHSHAPAAGTTAPQVAEDAGMEHEHDEVALGTFAIGDLNVELAQGHGSVEPGKESHLVVKLPYQDGGATVVRAWIGTEDRTLSLVGKASYAASHDDYDVHVMAPATLPEPCAWWVEIQRPDGSTVTGSAPVLRD